ncbi:hypothetical protein ACWDLG_39615 [Nonomuraea sp. NPDC003727]
MERPPVDEGVAQARPGVLTVVESGVATSNSGLPKRSRNPGSFRRA